EPRTRFKGATPCPDIAAPRSHGCGRGGHAGLRARCFHRHSPSTEKTESSHRASNGQALSDPAHPEKKKSGDHPPHTPSIQPMKKSVILTFPIQKESRGTAKRRSPTADSRGLPKTGCRPLETLPT